MTEQRRRSGNRKRCGTTPIALHDARLRYQGAWQRIQVSEIGPAGCKIILPGRLRRELGVAHVAFCHSGLASGTVHAQAEVLTQRADARGTVLGLRFQQIFSADGRPTLIEFLTRCLGRPRTEHGAFKDSPKGSYYDFTKEVFADTMPIARRKDSLRTSDQAPKTRRWGTGGGGDVGSEDTTQSIPPVSGDFVGRQTSTGMMLIPPKLLKLPTVGTDVTCAWRAGAENQKGTVFRATRDGHRMFVRVRGYVTPNLWDTVFLFMQIDSPVGAVKLHLRGTVIYILEQPEQEKPEGFVARLFQVGKGSDLETWRSYVERCGAERDMEKRRKKA